MSTTIAGYLLSPQQHRLWQMQQAATDHSFTTQGIFVLNGRPRALEVEQAVHAIIRRFEVLRTVYRWVPEQGLPLQVVLEEFPTAPLMSTRLEHPLSSMDEKLAELMKEERGRFFDLENGPLLHAHLLETPIETALLCTVPSITADPMSLPPLAAALQLEIDGSIATEPIQYLQYAEFQNEFLRSEASREAQDLWASMVACARPPALFGVTDEADLRHFHSEYVHVPAFEHLAQRVISFASARQVSTEAVWLTAWTVLLARFSASSAFHVGVVSSGRTDDELRDIVGTLARTLPMEVAAPPHTSFAELLIQIEMQLRDLRPAEDAFAEGGTGANAVKWATIFAFVEQPAPATENVICTSTPAGEYAVRLVAQVGVRHMFSAADNTLTIEYDPQRVPFVVATRLAQSLALLIEALLRQPDRDVYALPMLSDAAERAELEKWNGTEQADRPEETYAPTVLELLERCAVERSETVAIHDATATLVYRDVHERANRLARRFRAAGIRAESVVAVQMPLSWQAIVGILAVLKCGSAYLPLDPGLPRTRFDFIVKDGKADIVLSPDNWAEWETSAQEESGEPLGVVVYPAQAAYVIYTSGSTGVPKGVVVDHAGFAHYMRWCVQAYTSRRGDQVPLHSSLAFDLSITSLFAPLISGMRLDLASDTTMAALIDTVRKGSKFCWIKLTPSHARMLGTAIGVEGIRDRCRTLIVGGEALYSSDLSAWIEESSKTEVVNEYGPTETVVGCLAFQRAATDIRDGAVPIGKPITGARIYVLDAGLQPVPTGVPGELYVGGASLARGYLSRPDQTAERFFPDPFTVSGGRMYRTGDLVRTLADGTLEYMGRLDEQVKIRGYRVEVAEVEVALATHPAINEVVVLAETETNGTSLAAYFVVGRDGVAPSVSALRSFLSSRLPEYMIPPRFIQIAVLPYNANGKLDRAKLLRSRGDRVEERYKSLPTSLEEEVLAKIWANALGRQSVGVDEDYFSLGGDSIRAIYIVGQASQRDLNLSIEMIFRYRTVRDLARAIRTGTQNTGGLLAPEPFCLLKPEDRNRVDSTAQDAYPLSALQAGMIFHREFHPESAIYHDIFGYHLRMPLDIEKLDQSARALVERHPALRTAFHLNGFSEPMQIVHRDAPSPLHVRDLRHLTDEAQVNALHAWMEEEKERGFDYLDPPLLRFWVHRRTDDSFQFSLSFHHAIIDGWSDANMLMEFAISYQRLLEGRDVGFEAPATKYREFVALERHALGSQEHRDYWQNELAGGRPLVLPRWKKNPSTDHGRRGVKLQVVPIREDVSAALQALAKAHAVPLKSVLLAAHIKVMSVLGGAGDVLSSLSSAGRPETLDGDQVLGLHLNSTPVRVQLDHDGSWIDLIHRVFAKEREALPFRRYPLAEIQKLVGSRRLSETSFYYTHYHNIQRLTDLPQFEILGRMVYEETSFAMVANFNLDPFSEHLGLTLACDQTEFGEAERQVFGDLYEKALVALAETPDSKYSSVDLVSDPMRTQILALSDGDILQERPGLLPEWIASAAADAANQPAVVLGHTSLSYSDLFRQADRLAAALVRTGVAPGETVALIMPRCVEMVIALLGVHRAGAAYLPVDEEFPEERKRFIVDDAKVSAALRLDDVRRILQDSQSPDASLPVAVDSTTPAYVIYTSGSMGVPKGTVISHGNLAASTAARLQFYREPVRSYLLLSSFAFDSSVAGIFWTLATGGTLVLPEDGEQRDPVRIHGLLQDHRISHMLALPGVYAGVLQVGTVGDLPRLERVIVAGEVCPPALVEEHFRRAPWVQLFNEYGPTEATVWATVERCSPSDESVSIGVPVPGYSTFVLDEMQHLAPIGTPGELYIGGPGVAHGYLNRPALTQERFVPSPPSTGKTVRLYRTGDRVLRYGDGTLSFLGRSDNQVKIRGYRVELEEVESVLREAFATNDVAVIAQEDQPGHHRLIGFVANSGTSISGRDEAVQRLLRRLPEYMVPTQFMYLDALPLTATGKVDRRSLAHHAQDETAPTNTYVAPESGVEKILAAIWQRVLGKNRVGVTDDFFALGGDSILSIQIIARAREAGLGIQPRQLFACRTIAALAALPEIEMAVDTPNTVSSNGEAGSLVGISEMEAEGLLAQLTTDRLGQQ